MLLRSYVKLPKFSLRVARFWTRQLLFGASVEPSKSFLTKGPKLLFRLLRTQWAVGLYPQEFLSGNFRGISCLVPLRASVLPLCLSPSWGWVNRLRKKVVEDADSEANL